MTQNFHDPYQAEDALTASGLNERLSDLDGAITQRTAAGSAAGDLAIFNGTNWERLAAGNAGQALVADSNTANGVAWGEYAPLFYLDMNSLVVESGNIVQASINGARMTGGAGTASLFIDANNSGVNGLIDGSLEANTFYQVRALEQDGTGQIDGCLNEWGPEFVLPDGYVSSVMVGYVRTNGDGDLIEQVSSGGKLRRTVYRADTTAAPFLIMDGVNVNHTQWDSVSASFLSPLAFMVTVYVVRANAGGVLSIRTQEGMVHNFLPVGVMGGIYDLPIVAGGFEITASGSGNEAVTMQVQGCWEAL